MYTDNITFLGINVEKDVKWNGDITKLCKKLGTPCFTIRCFLLLTTKRYKSQYIISKWI